MPVTTTNKRADKFRTMADKLASQIEDKFRDRDTNTHKKQAQAVHARNEGLQLQRIQAALYALADGIDAGTLPPALASLTSKADIHPLLTKRTTHVANGYHSYHVETNEYHDNGPLAIALRNLIDGAKSESSREAEAEQARKLEIEKLEMQMKFSNIEGFFPTPPEVIDRMLTLADIHKPSTKILEPSAGKGDIADAILALAPDAEVRCYERNHSLFGILDAKEHDAVCADFLAVTAIPQYDLVLMNPPFEAGQDAVHVRRAYEHLKPGGRLIAIISSGTMSRSDRKATEFREWLNQQTYEPDGAPYVECLGAGAFKSAFRSTGVSVHLICVDKPPYSSSSHSCN